MKKLLSALVYTGMMLGAISAPARAAPDGVEALVTGEMRKLVLAEAPEPLPADIPWEDKGGTVTLGDYAGKWVVLNFWAVWCGPCREEMPTLAALKDAREGADFAVVTLASGPPNTPGKVAQFLEEEGAATLPHFRDPRSAQSRASAVFGMPVTVIVDPDGREVARLVGGADWNSPEAHAVLDAFMQGGD